MLKTRWASAAAVFGLAAIGMAVAPYQAKAWWHGGVGVGIYVPPVVVGPPVVYPPPPVYAPPVYAPPPVVYAPPVYAAPRVWIRPRWEGPYWVPGHWS